MTHTPTHPDAQAGKECAKISEKEDCPTTQMCRGGFCCNKGVKDAGVQCDTCGKGHGQCVACTESRKAYVKGCLECESAYYKSPVFNGNGFQCLDLKTDGAPCKGHAECESTPTDTSSSTTTATGACRGLSSKSARCCNSAAVQDEHCATCGADGGKCKTCASGFTLDDSTGTCKRSCATATASYTHGESMERTVYSSAAPMEADQKCSDIRITDTRACQDGMWKNWSSHTKQQQVSPTCTENCNVIADSAHVCSARAWLESTTGKTAPFDDWCAQATNPTQFATATDVVRQVRFLTRYADFPSTCADATVRQVQYNRCVNGTIEEAMVNLTTIHNVTEELRISLLKQNNTGACPLRVVCLRVYVCMHP